MPLVELRVDGLALLQGVTIAPGPGLTVLTGETGSGKSLALRALRYAVGGRAEGEAAGGEAERVRVAAVFAGAPEAVTARLLELGVPPDDLLTLARELPRDGRGACRINGALVSLATLREVGESLVELTGQGESQRLGRPAHQRALLDAFGGPSVRAARREAAGAVAAWRAAAGAVEAATAARAARAALVDSARDVVATLTPLELRLGEVAALTAERLRLRHAVRLSAAAAAVHGATAGGDDAGGAADLLSGALATAAGVAGLAPDLDAVAAEGIEIAERLRDLGARARRCAEVLVVDDRRLAEVEARLDQLDRVKRRFGGLDEAASALEEARRTLEVDAGDPGIHLNAERDRCAAAAEAAVQRLTEARAAAAARLERDVTARLRRLRLPQGRLRVVLGTRPDADGLPVGGARLAAGPDGVDTVEFRLATSADGVPLPLDQGPSGGELSRLALAVRSVVAVGDDCPTLVLDEVDTGLGGETAARVGEALAEIACSRQVLVVTHRAEIAARASAHLVAERHEGPGGPRSGITRAEGEGRTVELARLLSGRATAAALARASELLEEGGSRPPAATTIARR